MKTLTVIKTITVYKEDGGVNFRVRKGETLQGSWNGLLGGYACERDGEKFLVLHDEVVVC